MRASRKLSWLMLLVMVVGMVLTACGGAEQPTNTAEVAAPEATQAPAPTKETVAEYECTDEFGCVTVAKGENLRIATALVISGANESLGIDSQRGVEIAIDDRQEVLGFPIELVAEDGQCSAEGGQTAATKITSDETIVAVVGHNCSSSCTPAAPIYDQAGYTMISPSCTAPALTAPDTHVASFLRTCHNDKVQGSAAAQFFYNELGIRKAATIHDGSPYAEQLQQVFADTFRELGGEITAQEAVNVGDTDMRPLLTSIAVDEPELIYYPIFIAEGGFITVQAREIMGNDVILAGADGMISPDFVEAAGSAGEGMYITGPNLDFSDNPLGIQFEEEHLAKYGEAPISAFHAHAYDAANIIFDSIEEVGVLDTDGNLHVPRKALRDAVYATSNFNGVTGSLTCDADGDCADPSITVHQITNGEYVGIWNDQKGYLTGAGATAGEDLLDQVTAAGKLVVSTDPNYAPQSFLDDQGELDGFDINVAQEVAKRLGVEIEFVTPDWDIITGGNWGGRWDISIGSMTPTEPRAEVLWFTDPYYYTPAAFAVHQDNTTIGGVADLEGKTIGLGTATTYEAYLEGNLQIMGGDIMYDPPADVTVQPYSTDAEAIQDLALGDGVRLDAVMSAAPTIQEAIDSGVPLKFVGTPAFYEPLAFALDKGRGPSDQMLSKLNEIIAAMHDDGTLSALSMEWYGIDITQQVGPGEAQAGEVLSSYEAPNCDYGGEFLKMEALDNETVRFTLCAPDVAFPSKVAFSAFAIHSSDYLEATGGGGDLVDNPIGTGPYMLSEWRRGDQIIMERNPDYWGTPPIADTLVFRWSTEGAQRLLELQSGSVDGIDNPSPDDFATIEADDNLILYPREALNVFYLGMNNTYPPFDDERVRQAIAMGIDRQRIVDNFYPEGSTVASHFTPCAIPGGCEGEEWYEFDPEAARALLAEAGYPDGFSTEIAYRDVFRGYLPEPALVAQDLQSQLQNNLNINAEIVVMESGEFIDAADAGQLPGFHMLGWGADYPDQTNFLDFHFGEGASDQFGDGFPDIWDALRRAGSLSDQAARNEIYLEANNLIKQHVPMVPISHGGSATVFLADVEGAHASPLSNEYFAVMDPGGRDTIVWMQNAEPIGLYCADETDGESLRACEQINESLLAYQVGGTAVEPALAESYEANEDLTVWTFHLRPGVKFHDGSDLDAIDVITSYAVQWDAEHPLHVGRDGSFTYWPGLFGPFLNAPTE